MLSPRRRTFLKVLIWVYDYCTFSIYICIPLYTFSTYICIPLYTKSNDIEGYCRLQSHLYLHLYLCIPPHLHLYLHLYLCIPPHLHLYLYVILIYPSSSTSILMYSSSLTSILICIPPHLCISPGEKVQ